MPHPPADDALLDRVQRTSFTYFRKECNPANGLVVDSTHPDTPASIAAVGFALSCYPVAVERGWMPRAEALARTTSLSTRSRLCWRWRTTAAGSSGGSCAPARRS